jgi:hypothetical protein
MKSRRCSARGEDGRSVGLSGFCINFYGIKSLTASHMFGSDYLPISRIFFLDYSFIAMFPKPSSGLRDIIDH